MSSKILVFCLIAAALPMSGCIASKIVTVPVKTVAAGIDAVTTSQKEADEKRGREARKREKYCRKHPDRC
ncbi:hypothetical protein QO010_004650 [Caulobacter ginsengisoli]|uniref:Lipoprotein n=1 Tax=Caulobacter ginsengisoli TaxID=400775 RepID=A0ABU0IXW9_9CAUL|nr:DUF6726 family protein [Caulobacter ginsengisoli]MDQ0466854.1 hypothetical protein [Caulobacter ginsengisoli]